MHRFLTILTVFSLALASCGNGGVEEWNGGNKPSGGDDNQPVVPASERWAALADSCTNVLVTNYLDVTTGTFWSSPRDVEHKSTNIYWQQAHALDVLLYSYARIKDEDSALAEKYLGYFEKWYDNDANNYNNSRESEGEYGGFFNDWTDDMAWICLTLLKMTEFTGVEKYASTARDIYDNYIWTRSTRCDKGVCLPWTNHEEDKTNFNACTNVPSCLVAALLYRRFNEAKYLDNAKALYDFNINNMPDEDRVEEPPLSYTQGTFAEASRILYHITGERSYMSKAGQVLKYCLTGNRTTDSGLLRSEGENMDQSIFKAVFVPYAVNFVLDSDADASISRAVKEKLLQNAEALDRNLDRTYYPSMYCNYYWGTAVKPGATVQMGAQVSGASLIENVARMVAGE